MQLLFNFSIGALWLIMLVAAAMDCLKSKNERKVAWMAVIIRLPFLGPILFFRFAHGQIIGEL